VTCGPHAIHKEAVHVLVRTRVDGKDDFAFLFEQQRLLVQVRQTIKKESPNTLSIELPDEDDTYMTSPPNPRSPRSPTPKSPTYYTPTSPTYYAPTSPTYE